MNRASKIESGYSLQNNNEINRVKKLFEELSLDELNNINSRTSDYTKEEFAAAAKELFNKLNREARVSGKPGKWSEELKSSETYLKWLRMKELVRGFNKPNLRLVETSIREEGDDERNAEEEALAKKTETAKHEVSELKDKSMGVILSVAKEKLSRLSHNNDALSFRESSLYLLFNEINQIILEKAEKQASTVQYQTLNDLIIYLEDAVVLYNLAGDNDRVDSLNKSIDHLQKTQDRRSGDRKLRETIQANLKDKEIPDFSNGEMINIEYFVNDLLDKMDEDNNLDVKGLLKNLSTNQQFEIHNYLGDIIGADTGGKIKTEKALFRIVNELLGLKEIFDSQLFLKRIMRKIQDVENWPKKKYLTNKRYYSQNQEEAKNYLKQRVILLEDICSTLNELSKDEREIVFNLLIKQKNSNEKNILLRLFYKYFGLYIAPPARENYRQGVRSDITIPEIKEEEEEEKVVEKPIIKKTLWRRLGRIGISALAAIGLYATSHSIDESSERRIDNTPSVSSNSTDTTQANNETRIMRFTLADAEEIFGRNIQAPSPKKPKEGKLTTDPTSKDQSKVPVSMKEAKENLAKRMGGGEFYPIPTKKLDKPVKLTYKINNTETPPDTNNTNNLNQNTHAVREPISIKLPSNYKKMNPPDLKKKENKINNSSIWKKLFGNKNTP